MHINKVKTATFVGEFIPNNDSSPNLISIKYEVPEDVLRDESPRVYLIVVDGIIKKIGGSSGKGGIKNTINFYINARTGSPGPVRFIIHGLIAQELKKKRKVTLHMIRSEKVEARICGLFDCDEVMEIAGFKEMEDKCKFDYVVYELEQFINNKESLFSSPELKECLLRLKEKLNAFKNLRKDFINLQQYILGLNISDIEGFLNKVKTKIERSNLFFKRIKIRANEPDIDSLKSYILSKLQDKYKEVVSKPKEKVKSEMIFLQKEGIKLRLFPEWNFQENNEPYPDDLYKEYLEYHEKRIEKK